MSSQRPPVPGLRDLTVPMAVANGRLKAAELVRRLACCLQDCDPDSRRLALILYRKLALGHPVSSAALALETGLRLARVIKLLERRPGVVKDKDGAVVAFGGLALAPASTQRFEVDGRTLYTWCAWDALFIPQILQRTAQVHSVCPESGAPIELLVSPHGVQRAQPDTTCLSFVLPERQQLLENVMENFCCHVHFFRDGAAAAAWCARHGAFVLGLQDAFALGRALVRQQFGEGLLPQLTQGPLDFSVHDER